MGLINVSASFEPKELKAYSKNEAVMTLRLENTDPGKTYWCECDVKVDRPLSLEHDGELLQGRTRVGILPPHGTKEKQIRLYTGTNSVPDEYVLNITAYAYDEDGAVSDRMESRSILQCVEAKSAGGPGM
ncbi:MAG: DUF4981 domain-containing protein [Candidatus Marsarchaeota archaeon]|jgi:hypothetical protein|nr:DUF4981 domain-containing protein [Candidatus Marsarchaeota archaeon]